jgi:hypothetical protein
MAFCKTLLLSLSVILLNGCSQSTELSARFINGRLAFVPLDNPLGCIRDIEVSERVSGRVVWKVDYDHSEARACTGGAPIFFGWLPGRAASKSAERLKVGIVYEVSGSAAGGNYFGGMFRITRMVGYRAEDVARSRSMTLAEDVKNTGP